MNRKKAYIFYETGPNCTSYFLMKNGEFRNTEDAVVIGIADGFTAEEAFKELKREMPHLKEYIFDKLVAREAGKPIYL